MKTVTTLKYKTEEFLIVKELRHTNKPGEAIYFYHAINKKYIDSDGRLTRQLNGFQMCSDQNMKACMNGAMDHVDLEELKAQGIEITPSVVLDMMKASGRYEL